MAVIHKEGRVVSRTRNLRGVIDYARRHGVKRASAYAKGEGRGFIAFHFADGAESRVDFESYVVAWRWIESRRSWGLSLAGHSETLRDYVA